MNNRSKNLLTACLFAIALTAIALAPIPCFAQATDGNGASTTPTRGDESDTETADQQRPQSTSQSSISSLASRVKAFNRNAPTRDSWNTIDLGSKYLRAVVGGFDQGALIGFGVQLTTADKFRFVEFRATALTSPNLYRRFEGEAYFPRVFDKNTHADRKSTRLN